MHAFVSGGVTTLGVLKGEEKPVIKEGVGELSSSGASGSGLGLQSLLGASQPDLKPKPDLLSTALSSSGTYSWDLSVTYKLRCNMSSAVEN